MDLKTENHVSLFIQHGKFQKSKELLKYTLLDSGSRNSKAKIEMANTQT
jgi:hypothetical protein